MIGKILNVVLERLAKNGAAFNIFELKLAGNSGAEIARILNARGVPSPAQYALDKGIGMDWRRINEQTGWDDSVIMNMLRDERYVGHT